MAYFSRALGRRNPCWKREVYIPRGGLRGTRAELARRIRRLCDVLRTERPEMGDWRVARLYARYFELSAQWILYRDFPALYRQAMAGMEPERAGDYAETLFGGGG